MVFKTTSSLIATGLIAAVDRGEICLSSRSDGFPVTIHVRLSTDGKFFSSSPAELQLIQDGPVRSEWITTLKFHHPSATTSLVGELRMISYAHHPIAEFEFTIRNPNPMDHPGGNWDLGAEGNILIDDLSIDFVIRNPHSECTIKATLEKGKESVNAHQSFELFQCSSGGEHWNSLNHMDRHRRVPMAFRGYRAICDAKPIEGLRATPIVLMNQPYLSLGIAVPKFWQNFPMSLRADSAKISLGLFPRESGYPHEIQGGEQKTYEFGIKLCSPEQDVASPDSSLESWHDKTIPLLSIDKYRKEPLLRHLSAPNDPSLEYDELVNQAITGSDTFESKSEKIDEYGWRHYGDIYGDHEAVYHKGPTPLISHYNNQYDCTAGFAYQWLRTGDRRWYELMIAMADHAWDIDTYHTTGDKSLYNGGLFWHTYHYADADTGTHRSYPRSLKGISDLQKGKDLTELGKTGNSLKKVYAVGGGPAASHNYSTGWLIAYFLTGKERYKTATLNAADYVLRIEDGTKTPFRWLCRGDTGYATCSSDNYYGPGRASANSTLALLNGYELTNDKKYLQFAIKLMSRTVHPNQDLEKLDLLNAELRWFYTMYLQALARLVDTLETLPEFEQDFHYAVESLLHYARWMVEHEHPILDHPERLQYPTETWAAQDIRKWHVLAMASKWCDSREESARMMERAEFFYHYVVNTLHGFPTKSLCRPVVLMLNYGWQRSRLLTEPMREKKWTKKAWPAMKPFEPQKAIAVRRAKRMLMIMFGLGLVALTALIGVLASSI